MLSDYLCFPEEGFGWGYKLYSIKRGKVSASSWMGTVEPRQNWSSVSILPSVRALKGICALLAVTLALCYLLVCILMKWGHKSMFAHAGVMEMHGVDSMVITV